MPLPSVLQLTYFLPVHLSIILLFILLFIPSSAFFISVIIFFNPGWLFFIFSNTKLFITFHCAPILFPSSWTIFTSLNSLSDRMHIYTSLQLFWALILFLHLEYLPLSPVVIILFYFYVYGRLVTEEKWPSVGDILCVLAVHSPLKTKWPGTNWSPGRFWPVFADSIPQAMGLYISCFWCLPPGGWSRSRGSCRLPGVRSWYLPTGGGVVSWPSSRHGQVKGCI